jgi:hypothetical protein
MVHHDALYDLNQTWPLRAKEDMQAVLAEARLQGTKGAKEDILKNSGLHDIDVSTASQVPSKD